MSKIVSRDELLRIRDRMRADGKVVVLTNGCFDILHVGHVRYLQQARALGDCLIVGLNDDSSMRRLKGKKRPLVPEGERAEILASLDSVDYVVLFHETTAEQLAAELKPDIYAKGGDYAQEGAGEGAQRPSGKDLPEASVVASYGGKVVLLPLQVGHSTTDLIKTILERYSKT